MKLHLQLFAPDPTYYRGQHELAKFNATGPGTVDSADILPTSDKGLIVLNITSVVGTPSIAVYVDTYDQIDGAWIAEESAAIVTESPTGAATYAIPVGPATTNNSIILGDRARVRYVVSGAGASITGNSMYIETDTEGGD